MLLDESPQASAIACQVISVLRDRQPIPSNVASVLSGNGVVSDKVQGGVSSNNVPAWAACVQGGTLTIFVDGTQWYSQAALLYQGYLSASVGVAGFHVNPFAYSLSQQLLTVLGQYYPNWSGDVTIYGWSLGGAVGESIAQEYGYRGTRTVRCISFGCPRTTDKDSVRLFTPSVSVRYMNWADIVPLIPPRLEELPEAAITYGLDPLAHMGCYCHVAGGMMLLPDGTTRVAELPSPGVFPATQAALVQWLLGVGDGAREHSIRTYLDRLNRVTTSDAGSGGFFGVTSGPEDAADDVPSSFDGTSSMQPTAVQFSLNSTIGISKSDVQGEVFKVQQRGENMALHIPAPLRFTAAGKGSGPNWGVTLLGTAICLPTTQGRAKAIARNGNKFLRSLLSENAAIDPANLAAMILGWCGAAANPTSGCIPVLTTGSM